MDSSLLCTLLIILSFLHASFSPVVDAKTNGFTLDVIHRHSKHSPIYRQSAAATPTSENGPYEQGSKTMSFGSGEYAIMLYLGNPPVEVYAAVDTGSDYIWLQSASACPDCYQQNVRLYDPSQSSTYNLVNCYEPECQKLTQQHGCGYQDECSYFYQYGDQSFSSGVMSREMLSISSGSSEEDWQIVLAENPIAFGCAQQVSGSMFEEYHVGIIGLNRGPLSLISQLGIQKFSYCLQPLHSHSTGKIAFGDNVIIDESVTEVVSTPLIQFSAPFDNYYYANLEGATIAGSKTMIPNQGNSTYGTHILLDSGTTLNYLEPGFYKSLRAAVKSSVNLKPVTNDTDSDLCYDKFPEKIEIVFHFTGAEVKLKPVNLFRDQSGRGELFCFAMLPSTAGGDSGTDAMSHIWGNTAQIDFQVVIDIANSIVSFAPADCGHV